MHDIGTQDRRAAVLGPPEFGPEGALKVGFDLMDGPSLPKAINYLRGAVCVIHRSVPTLLKCHQVRILGGTVSSPVEEASFCENVMSKVST